MNDKITESLQKNGFDFLNFGLQLILSSAADAKDVKVSVANIQIGLELLIKYSLAKKHGLQYICITDLTSRTEAQIAEFVEAGTLKTKKYELCKQGFIEGATINGYERDLIDRFQRLRNSIVHFGAVLPREQTIAQCAHIVLKVVRRIVEPECDTWLRNYLSQDVYNHLIKFPPYIAEAIDDAYDSGNEVRLCFECSNETLTTLPNDDHYCFSCGFRVFSKHAPYIDCPYCKRYRTAVYDCLNNEEGIFRGKCIACEEDLRVAKCASCDVEVFPEIFAEFDEIANKWYCDKCHEMEGNESQS